MIEKFINAKLKILHVVLYFLIKYFQIVSGRASALGWRY